LSEFAAFQAFDYERFALASLETMAHCKSDPSRRRAISWPLLKAYYSGFFGGHALLRVVGQSIIRLEAPQAKQLTKIGKLYCGQTFTFATGTYDLRVAQNPDRTVDVSLTRLDETGGAHSIFWRRFHAFLTEIAADIATSGEPDANLAISRVQELQALLTANGANSGSWLALIRNQINYQHEYGVWFPFGASESDVRNVARIGYLSVANTRMDFAAKKEPLKAFCTGSLFISALSFDVAAQLVGGATQRGTQFGRKWQRLGRETGLA
jgi:hypothetical protein